MWPSDDSKDSERAMNIGLGAASPLWPGFFLTAAAGVAYWGWMRWFKPMDSGAEAVQPNLPAPLAEPDETPETKAELVEIQPETEPEPEPVLVIEPEAMPRPVVADAEAPASAETPAPLMAEAVAPVVVPAPVAAAKTAPRKAPAKPKLPTDTPETV